MEKQIQLLIEEKDKDLILKASEIMAVGHSTFCRVASVEKARSILRENQMEVSAQ